MGEGRAARRSDAGEARSRASGLWIAAWPSRPVSRVPYSPPRPSVTALPPQPPLREPDRSGRVSRPSPPSASPSKRCVAGPRPRPGPSRPATGSPSTLRTGITLPAVVVMKTSCASASSSACSRLAFHAKFEFVAQVEDTLPRDAFETARVRSDDDTIDHREYVCADRFGEPPGLVGEHCPLAPAIARLEKRHLHVKPVEVLGGRIDGARRDANPLPAYHQIEPAAALDVVGDEDERHHEGVEAILELPRVDHLRAAERRQAARHRPPDIGVPQARERNKLVEDLGPPRRGRTGCAPGPRRRTARSAPGVVQAGRRRPDSRLRRRTRRRRA